MYSGGRLLLATMMGVQLEFAMISPESTAPWE